MYAPSHHINKKCPHYCPSGQGFFKKYQILAKNHEKKAKVSLFLETTIVFLDVLSMSHTKYSVIHITAKN